MDVYASQKIKITVKRVASLILLVFYSSLVDFYYIGPYIHNITSQLKFLVDSKSVNEKLVIKNYLEINTMILDAIAFFNGFYRAMFKDVKKHLSGDSILNERLFLNLSGSTNSNEIIKMTRDYTGSQNFDEIIKSSIIKPKVKSDVRVREPKKYGDEVKLEKKDGPMLKFLSFKRATKRNLFLGKDININEFKEYQNEYLKSVEKLKELESGSGDNKEEKKEDNNILEVFDFINNVTNTDKDNEAKIKELSFWTDVDSNQEKNVDNNQQTELTFGFDFDFEENEKKQNGEDKKKKEDKKVKDEFDFSNNQSNSSKKLNKTEKKKNDGQNIKEEKKEIQKDIKPKTDEKKENVNNNIEQFFNFDNNNNKNNYKNEEKISNSNKSESLIDFFDFGNQNDNKNNDNKNNENKMKENNDANNLLNNNKTFNQQQNLIQQNTNKNQALNNNQPPKNSFNFDHLKMMNNNMTNNYNLNTNKNMNNVNMTNNIKINNNMNNSNANNNNFSNAGFNNMNLINNKQNLNRNNNAFNNNFSNNGQINSQKNNPQNINNTNNKNDNLNNLLANFNFPNTQANTTNMTQYIPSFPSNNNTNNSINNNTNNNFNFNFNSNNNNAFNPNNLALFSNPNAAKNSTFDFSNFGNNNMLAQFAKEPEIFVELKEQVCFFYKFTSGNKILNATSKGNLGLSADSDIMKSKDFNIIFKTEKFKDPQYIQKNFDSKMIRINDLDYKAHFDNVKKNENLLNYIINPNILAQNRILEPLIGGENNILRYKFMYNNNVKKNILKIDLDILYKNILQNGNMNKSDGNIITNKNNQIIVSYKNKINEGYIEFPLNINVFALVGKITIIVYLKEDVISEMNVEIKDNFGKILKIKKETQISYEFS